MDDLFGEMKLRKRFITDTQRQQVGKALRDAGFGRDDFAWEERRSQGEKTEFIILAVVHKERGYYYAFNFTDGGGHYMERHPGESESVDYEVVGSWDEQYRGFLEWVNLLKRELAVTDWWGDIEESAGSVSGEPPNTPFTTQEQAEITQRLDELQAQLLREHQLSEEHRAFVKRQFDELRSLIKSQTKRKAFYSSRGLVWSIIKAVASDPSARSLVVNTIKHLYQTYFGDVPQLPDLTQV